MNISLFGGVLFTIQKRVYLAYISHVKSMRRRGGGGLNWPKQKAFRKITKLSNHKTQRGYIYIFIDINDYHGCFYNGTWEPKNNWFQSNLHKSKNYI